MDLNADLVLDVAGSGAVGGDAVGSDITVVLSATDTIGGDSYGHPGGDALVEQNVGPITSIVTGGDAKGGDGIELDLVLDAIVELVLDANIAVDTSVNTDIAVDLNDDANADRSVFGAASSTIAATSPEAAAQLAELGFPTLEED